MGDISAKRVIITSFVVDFIDIITNITVALITGSIVMTTESIQGFADLTAVALLYIGYTRGRKSADAQHPLGYGRELYFWTLLSSILMLGFTATISFYLGLLRVLHPEQIHNIFLAFGVLTFSIITNGYALMLDIHRLSSNQPKRHIFRHFFRSEHIETKTTFVLDLMGITVAICGLISLFFLQITHDLRFDGFGAMIMGLVLAGLSLVLIWGTKELLIGKAASSNTHQKIRDIIAQFDEVRQTKKLQTVYEGSGKLLVLLDLHLKNDLSTNQIEKLTLEIKQQIKQQIPAVYSIQIELVA